MTTQVSHGAASRTPVYSGNRRIPGLYERVRADRSVVFEAALRLGGNVRRHTLVAETKTDAIHELAALQTDYRRGEEHRSPSAAITVSELLAEFVRHMASRVDDRDAKRRRASRTGEHYEYVIRRYAIPVFGHVAVPDLAVRDLLRMLDDMAGKGLSPSTRTGTLGAVSSMLRFAVRERIVDRNVVRELDRDDRPGAGRVTEPRYLDLDELRRLLAELSDTFRPIAATCAYAGLRASEALGLRWCDLDLRDGSIAVTGQLGANGERIPAKTAASSAVVPMLPAPVTELRAHRQRRALSSLALVRRDALVFTTGRGRGRPQNVRNVLRAVHDAGDKAGLNGKVIRTEGGIERERQPVGLHDLRHSFVAIALASGLTLPEASALARHANPLITARVYAGLTDDGRAGLRVKLADAFGG
ncbi:MAG: site-specific integrase [Gaiellales bacterium]